MATYAELQQRINELKSRTGKGSISPRETFGLMDELLAKTKGVDMTAQPLVVVKSYDTLALANADKNPVNPATNKPLAFGQLVSVTADGANNAVYRLAALAADGSPTWEKQAELGDMSGYAKKEEIPTDITKTGGSLKTAKDLETEIVQLAGNVDETKSNKLKRRPATANWYDKNRAVVGLLGTDGNVSGTSWRTSEFYEWGTETKMFAGPKTISGDFGSNNVYWCQYNADKQIVGERILSSFCDKHPDAVYFRISESSSSQMISPFPANQAPYTDYVDYVEFNENTKAKFDFESDKELELYADVNLIGIAEHRLNCFFLKSKSGMWYSKNVSLSCFVIAVQANTTYTRNKRNLFSDDYNSVGFLKDENRTSDILSYSDELTFTTPSDCRYIVVNGSWSHELQVTKGNSIGVFSKPHARVRTKNGLPIYPYIPTESGKNKFDKNTMTVNGFLVDFTNKTIVKNPSGSIAVIPVISGAKYARNTVLSNVNDQYKGVLELISYNFEDNSYRVAANAYNLMSFTVSANAKHIAVNIASGSTSIADALQVELGIESTDYEVFEKRATFEDIKFPPFITEELKDYITNLISKNNTSESDMKELKKMPSNYDVILDDANFRVYSPIRKITDKSPDIFPKVVALGGNVAVYAFNAYTIEIGENGIDGLYRLNNSSNPNRFELVNLPNRNTENGSSNFQSIHVLPYSRNSISGQINDYRVVIVTKGGQIYHNKPNRSVNGMDDPQAGDHLLFDESVVWDMPHRRLPSKTSNEFPYYFNPCISEPIYSPLLNTDVAYIDAYGNGGFGIQKTVSGIKYPRFYITHNGTELSPFRTMGGVVIRPGRMWLGTYNPSGDLANNKVTRTCVFDSTDGREFFVRYEFVNDVPTGNPIDTTLISQDYVANSLSLLDRDIDFPYSGNPSPAGLFKPKNKIVISSISHGSPAIITTSTPHNLPDLGWLAIQTSDGNSAPAGYEWMINDGAGVNSYGNGLFFGYKKLSETTLELREYISANNNNIQAHHIHSLNEVKDGVIIGTGEEYYTGKASEKTSTMFGRYPQSHFIHLSKKYIPTPLNSSEFGLMRPLGFIIENDDTCLHASDSDIAGKDVALPDGSLYRGATGLFRGRLADINDRSKFETILEAPEVCFFFQKIGDIYIFLGNAGFLALSTDLENWSTTHVRSTLFKYGGVDDLNRVCVDGLIIYRK